MHLIFDTETSGVFDWKKPPEAPVQPNIVQLGAILADDDGKAIAEINLIIKPEGWTIPDEVAKIHGITTAMAIKYGVPRKLALHVFSSLCEIANTTVAFNHKFDSGVIATNCHREGIKNPLDCERPEYCVMMAYHPICKIPNPNKHFGGYKWPNLMEAYKFQFNQEFDGAHSAMEDVKACARLYFYLFWKHKTQLQNEKDKKTPELFG